jgi:hypothetical protein
MKVLLDECVPWPMRKALPAHTCSAAQRMGWYAITNGEQFCLGRTAEDASPGRVASDFGRKSSRMPDNP